MLALSIAALAAAVVPLTIPGPHGDIAGTFVDAGKRTPIVLIMPGSGPTDRDGNNPLGVTAAPYRLLAEALASKGVSTLRADKRGMFGSKAAIFDANAVTIADYAADAHNWAEALRKRTGAKCVWVLGHSEGGLVALTAGHQPEGICGLVLVSTPGRKMSDLIREQLRANPANAPVLDPALKAIDSLEHGQRVDVTGMHPALQGLFSPRIQPYLIDTFQRDPAKLAAALRLPVLILQGERDLQVSTTDAKALASAQPKAKLVMVPHMNHVLKDVENDDRASNLATYADPSLPIDPQLVDAIADFVKAN
jgi:uncharacterized protein